MPLPVSRPAERVAAVRSHGAPTPARIRRRRSTVTWTKRLLPVGALLLLAAVALWPELSQDVDRERVTLRRLVTTTADGAQLTEPHYRSVDERGRPYTVTATTGEQVGADRVNLASPKGDVTMQNGTWLMVQAQRGVFLQHSGQLDLAGDATLYRGDGTTMVSDAATVDVKTGVAVSNDLTHAEGPFGTLDALGFAMLDKGSMVQFTGPARARLNSGDSNGQPPPASAPGHPPAPPVLARR